MRAHPGSRECARRDRAVSGHRRTPHSPRGNGGGSMSVGKAAPTRRTRIVSRLALATATGVMLAAIAAVAGASPASHLAKHIGSPATSSSSAGTPATAGAPRWTTPMRLTRPGGCMLYPALYKRTQPITGREWHRSAGYRVGWRYRVNTTWTMVLDYNRKNVNLKPRWAFVETSCLAGNQYPAGAKDAQGRVRNLWGRASHDWRRVRFGTTRLPGVHTTGIRSVTATYTAVRDNPRAFAI